MRLQQGFNEAGSVRSRKLQQVMPIVTGRFVLQ